MTILEIAKKANVSKSTVSRYLNNQSVSEKTKEILKKIIEEENFKPSESARKLRGISNEIGIIVQRINSTTVSQYLEGVVTTCLKNGLTPLILPTNFDDNKLDEFVQYGLRANYKGIIIMAHNEDLHYESKKTKIIVVGQKNRYHTSFVFEGERYFYEMVKEVAKNNKVKRIVFVTVELKDNEMESRGIGTKKVADELNIEYVELKGKNFNGISSDFDLREGDYYVCITDGIALSLYRGIHKSTLKLGKDIFLSGYGGYPISEDFELTTVYNDYYKLGESVVLRLENKKVENIKVKSKIIYRASTHGN